MTSDQATELLSQTQNLVVGVRVLVLLSALLFGGAVFLSYKSGRGRGWCIAALCLWCFGAQATTTITATVHNTGAVSVNWNLCGSPDFPTAAQGTTAAGASTVVPLSWCYGPTETLTCTYWTSGSYPTCGTGTSASGSLGVPNSCAGTYSVDFYCGPPPPPCYYYNGSIPNNTQYNQWYMLVSSGSCSSASWSNWVSVAAFGTLQLNITNCDCNFTFQAYLEDCNGCASKSSPIGSPGTGAPGSGTGSGGSGGGTGTPPVNPSTNYNPVVNGPATNDIGAIYQVGNADIQALNAFSQRTHSDLFALLAALNAFAAQNHLDLSAVINDLTTMTNQLGELGDLRTMTNQLNAVTNLLGGATNWLGQLVGSLTNGIDTNGVGGFLGSGTNSSSEASSSNSVLSAFNSVLPSTNTISPSPQLITIPLSSLDPAQFGLADATIRFDDSKFAGIAATVRGLSLLLLTVGFVFGLIRIFGKAGGV